ncbi:MAG: glutamate racemase [Trueperella sp.]|nr:glutamate racemase [Trueperella sp.]
MNDAPIGIFDSGVGGLTVARAVINQLQNESVTYFGDTKNCPYGPRPLPEVRELAFDVMDNLVDQGVKMLVIACNTASAAVLEEAKENYGKLGIPVVGVIDPAARRAMRISRSGKIGVIGTQATISSGSYDRALDQPGLQITSAACPRFVEFAEAGITTGSELLEVAEEYLAPIKAAGVDTLVLGCTHYPLLHGVISYVMGKDVTLVSSAAETAQDVYHELTTAQMLRSEKSGPPTYTFNTSGDAEDFRSHARRFLGPEVKHVQEINTGA